MAQFNGTVENIENNKNKTQTIDENSTQEQYPSAAAVFKLSNPLIEKADIVKEYKPVLYFSFDTEDGIYVLKPGNFLYFSVLQSDGLSFVNEVGYIRENIYVQAITDSKNIKYFFVRGKVYNNNLAILKPQYFSPAFRITRDEETSVDVFETFSNGAFYTKTELDKLFENLNQEIAESKSLSLVFDTKGQLDDWLIEDEWSNVVFDVSGEATTNLKSEVWPDDLRDILLPAGNYKIQISTPNNELNDIIAPMSYEVVDGYYVLSLNEETTISICGSQTATEYSFGYSVTIFKTPYIRADGKTPADLQIGDNLYVVELGVPDYWWDGEKAIPIESLGIGKASAEGGEIFNDYESNRAMGEFSSARGSGNISGTKFFYIIGKNESASEYILKNARPFLDSGELEIGDVFSLTTGGNREDCGKILYMYADNEDVDVTVGVDNWYWDSTEEPDPEDPSTSFIFRIIDKPLCGTDFMGTGASSEGHNTKALMVGAHSEGGYTVAGGKYSHAEGRETRAGYSAHAEGWGTKALGQNAHSEGHFTNASGFYSHSEGNTTESSGICSHSEGNGTKSQGNYSHSEGTNTKATGEGSHSEGRNTTASGVGAHAEGSYSSDENNNNIYTEATGAGSHAEGLGTKATGYASHSEGRFTKASNSHTHAEGYKCEAQGSVSHAEGSETIAKGSESHAEGKNTLAKGSTSHAGGTGTIASGDSQTAIGRFNEEDYSALLVVGNGNSKTDRKTAFKVNKDGTATIQTAPVNDMDVSNKGYVDTEVTKLLEKIEQLENIIIGLTTEGEV